jgi:hypothetical protein
MEFVMTNRTQRLKASLFAQPREISLERALLYRQPSANGGRAGDYSPGESHRLDPR